MTDIQYRQVNATDINPNACILILAERLHDDKVGANGRPQGLWREAVEALETGWCSLTHVWFAERGGETIGLAAIRNGNERTVNVFVKPPYRRQGVGSALLQLALKTGLSLKGVPTETGKDFYNKLNVTLLM